MHESVLSEEVLFWLSPRPGQFFIDGTLGAGGHASRILEKTGPQGKIIGFDRDPSALEEAGRVLRPFGERVTMRHDRYQNIPNRLMESHAGQVDGMLLDLGVSSMQLDNASRGFSFTQDGPLDMRMDPTESETAAKLIHRVREDVLREILWKWGEERFARRVARAIIRRREVKPIETTAELARVVAQAVPGSYRHGRIHPATRTFQAIRIAVNRELEELEAFLPSALPLLKEGGRMAVISFHSLEDRIVKRAFRDFKQQGLGVILTKKPIEASEAEAGRNPRARSAKLRVFMKEIR